MQATVDDVEQAAEVAAEDRHEQNDAVRGQRGGAADQELPPPAETGGRVAGKPRCGGYRRHQHEDPAGPDEPGPEARPSPAARARWPRRRLDDVGEAPDARFSFANERTYLAWNRTALGCVVAGLAVLNVLSPEGDDVGTEIVGVTLMVLGLALAAVSYVNWYAAEKALRLRRPVPHSPMLLVLAVVTGVVAIVAAIASVS